MKPKSYLSEGIRITDVLIDASSFKSRILFLKFDIRYLRSFNIVVDNSSSLTIWSLQAFCLISCCIVSKSSLEIIDSCVFLTTI